MKTVLVADDDDSVRGFVTAILTEAGYSVLTAKDGQEALEILGLKNVDMAIIDVNMPRMDGLSLANQIRANSRHSTIPILMLTARGAVKDQMKGFDAGADEYLIKPFKREDFLNRLKDLEQAIQNKSR